MFSKVASTKMKKKELVTKDPTIFKKKSTKVEQDLQKSMLQSQSFWRTEL